MAYKYQSPSRLGVDGRKAGKCISIVTGETVTRRSLNEQAKLNNRKKGKGNAKTAHQKRR